MKKMDSNRVGEIVGFAIVGWFILLIMVVVTVSVFRWLF